MNCTDPDCPCMEHKTPETHVAVCTIHNTPLLPAEAGYGYCDVMLYQPRGREWAPLGRCGARELRGAAWLPRALFNASDLPSEPEAAS